jgi:hypothetical protein
MSGRSAAWLARLVRDQEVEGSNPFAPTIILHCFMKVAAFSRELLVSLFPHCAQFCAHLIFQPP